MRTYITAAMLVLLVGCGTASHVVRLNTGQGQTIVFTPRSGASPVEVNESDFKKALGQMARQASSPAQPQQDARRLFEMTERSGTYAFDPRGRTLRPLAPGERLGRASEKEEELTRAYLSWCEHTGRPGDCLRLLLESPTVTGDGRFALAMGLARGIVLDEMLEAFKDMPDPHAMVSAVLWTWTTYMVLLSLPEPVSKGVAAVMTATIISYVGVGTFWGLITGFKQLMLEADHTTTFDQLRTAGERYGKVMGRNAARVFVMLATAALGNTVAGLASQVSKLPGALQAAVQAETQVGIRLAAVGEVQTIAVSAETVTIALAPGAVAMSSSGTSGGGASTPAPSSGGNISVKDDAHINVPKHNLDRLASTWPEQRQILIDSVRQLDRNSVSAKVLAKKAQGVAFESTIQVAGKQGSTLNLTIRWFKFVDGRIDINTAFVAP